MSHRNRIHPGSLAALGLFAAGCSFMARGPEQYRDDTRALLETKNSSVKACYDEALARDPSLAGDVTIHFTVEKKTGIIRDAEIDPDKTSAPQSLAQCVLSAMDGLQLTPEDQRDGIATFTYTFTAEGGKPAA